jgi:O-antigen ligase
VAEQKLLSGRLYIWNRYLETYAAGDDPRLLLGFGPDAWVETFGVYAHNTIVSYLYELGFAGAFLLVLVWIGMLWRAGQIRDWPLRGQLLSAHVGFVFLNMATMPFWQIEGLILYGVLCGYTICLSPARVRKPLLRHYTPPPKLKKAPDWWKDPAAPAAMQQTKAKT